VINVYIINFMYFANQYFVLVFTQQMQITTVKIFKTIIQ